MNRSIVTAISLFAAIGSVSAQAAEKPAITVFPFGTTRAAQNVSRDVADLASRSALAGVLASGRVTPKDRVADAGIKALLNDAQGIGQFGAKAIAQDKGLQSKYMLVGWIESADVKGSQPNKKGERTYNASVGVTIQLTDVETGGVVASKLMQVNNGLSSGDQNNCEGKKGFQLAACKAKSAATGSVVIDGSNSTPEKALAKSCEKLKDAVSAFIQENIK